MRRSWSSSLLLRSSQADRYPGHTRPLRGVVSHLRGGARATLTPLLRITKVRLKGKTLRLKRANPLTVFWKLGITHPALSFIGFGVYFKRKQKQKFAFFGYSPSRMREVAHGFTTWKPYNIYHWRGVRLVRQKMIRKAGKVSEYMK